MTDDPALDVTDERLDDALDQLDSPAFRKRTKAACDAFTESALGWVGRNLDELHVRAANGDERARALADNYSTAKIMLALAFPDVR
jgi:hypothetical protein